MTPQIKQRIDQLRRGEVPEGYKKTKVGIVPSDWEENNLGKYLHEYRELSNDIAKYPVYSSSRQGLIPQSQYYDNREAVETNLGYKIVPTGYVTYRHMSDDDIFHFNINNTGGEVLVSSEYPVFTSTQKGELGYIIPLLNHTARFRHFCRMQKMGGTRTRLYYKNLCEFKTAFPPLPEQKKIAEILSAQDKLIALKEKLIEEKKRQKKHIVHEILSQNIKLQKRDGSKYPQWDTNNIGTYLTSRNLKQIPTEDAPLMAFVADVGVVPKGERYDRSFLVKNDEKEYKRTELNDFIYSSNNLDVGSIGLNNYGSAVISVVYEIFSVNSNAIPIVISEIIQMKGNINKILRYRQGALYGQYRIFAEDFLSVEIDVPSFEEQQEIAKIMLSSEKEIELLQNELGQEKQKKKALMQLLLSGVVRVNV